MVDLNLEKNSHAHNSTVLKETIFHPKDRCLKFLCYHIIGNICDQIWEKLPLTHKDKYLETCNSWITSQEWMELLTCNSPPLYSYHRYFSLWNSSMSSYITELPTILDSFHQYYKWWLVGGGGEPQYWRGKTHEEVKPPNGLNEVFLCLKHHKK